MADLLQVYNRAISLCGSGDTIATLTENSRERKLCSLHIDLVRRMICMTAPWPSARSYTKMTLQKERDESLEWVLSDPNPTWKYRWNVPPNLLHPMHLVSWGAFEYTFNDIHTNERDPILYYVRDITSSTEWDIGLEIAITHYLAAHIAHPLSGDLNLAQNNYNIAIHWIEQTRVAYLSTFQGDVPQSLPEWITARGYQTLNSDRFIYPWPTLSFPGVSP